MRKTSKQTIGHAQTDVEMNKAGLVVAARPAHFSNPNVSVDYTKIRNLQSAAEGAQAFAASFGRLAQVQKKKEDERNGVLGKRAAMTDGAESLDGYDKFLAGKPAAYQTAYMSQKGYMAGNRRTQADKDFIRDHAQDFMTEEQLRKYIASRYKEDLKGNDNEDFNATYLAVADRNEAELVDMWKKSAYLQYQEDAVSTATENLRNDIASLPPDATPDQIHAAMRTMYDGMEAMGGVRANANAAVVQTIGDLAVETGNPELLEVFEMSSHSVEDPSKRIPGLANSSKYAGTIQDYKMAATRARDTGTTKKNQRAIYDGMQTADALVSKGMINQAKAEVEKLLDSGQITGQAAASKVDSLNAEYKKQVRAHQQLVAFRGGGYWPADTTMDQRRDVATANATDKINTAMKTGDVNEIMKVKNEVMLDDSRNGVINSYTRDGIKYTQPDASPDPSQWNNSHNDFMMYKEENPRLLYKEIGADAWNRHEMYSEWIDMGYPAANARAMTQQYDSPEVDKRVKEILSGQNKYELRDALSNQLDGTLKSDALISEAMENAARIYAVSGNMDVAAKLAAEAIKVRYRKVDLPEDVHGNDEIWVDTRGINYGKGYGKAQTDFNDDPELRAELELDEDTVLFWDSNPFDRDGTVIVFRSDTMSPVMRNGRVMKVDPLTAITENNAEEQAAAQQTLKDNMLTTEEMQTEWEAKQKSIKPHGRGVVARRKRNK